MKNFSLLVFAVLFIFSVPGKSTAKTISFIGGKTFQVAEKQLKVSSRPGLPASETEISLSDKIGNILAFTLPLLAISWMLFWVARKIFEKRSDKDDCVVLPGGKPPIRGALFAIFNSYLGIPCSFHYFGELAHSGLSFLTFNYGNFAFMDVIAFSVTYETLMSVVLGAGGLMSLFGNRFGPRIVRFSCWALIFEGFLVVPFCLVLAHAAPGNMWAPFLLCSWILDLFRKYK